MERRQFAQWLDRIFATADHEVDCSQFRELIPAYIDARVEARVRGDVRGEKSLGHGAEIRLHLKQCPDCADLYRSVCRAASLEASGELPTVAELLAELAPEPEAQLSDWVAAEPL